MKWYNDKRETPRYSRDQLLGFVARWNDAQAPLEVDKQGETVTMKRTEFERILALRTIPIKYFISKLYGLDI